VAAHEISQPRTSAPLPLKSPESHHDEAHGMESLAVRRVGAVMRRKGGSVKS